MSSNNWLRKLFGGIISEPERNGQTTEWLEKEERRQHREVVQRLDRTEQQIKLIKQQMKRRKR